MGLKPVFVFTPTCPAAGCNFELRYHVRDPQVHPDNWAMTEETHDHLEYAHQPELDNVVSIVKLTVTTLAA